MKVAVVTGSAKGLGKDIAISLAKDVGEDLVVRNFSEGHPSPAQV